MAEQVCDAARLAALDTIDAVARIAADRGAKAPNRSRDVANRALTRATVMQAELDQFVSAFEGDADLGDDRDTVPPARCCRVAESDWHIYHPRGAVIRGMGNLD